MNNKNLIRENVVTVQMDQTVGEAARIMNREQVGSALVLEDQTPIGIVTDRDLSRKIVAEENHPGKHDVVEIMSTDVQTASADSSLTELLRIMYDNSIRRLPLVDDKGSITGLITLDDVLVQIAGHMQDISGIIQSESPPYDLN